MGKTDMVPPMSVSDQIADAGAHPEDICQDCGQPNPPWFAPNEIWNKFVPDRVGIFCPNCFAKRAKEKGFAEYWKFAPETEFDRAQAQEVNDLRAATRETRGTPPDRCMKVIYQIPGMTVYCTCTPGHIGNCRNVFWERSEARGEALLHIAGVSQPVAPPPLKACTRCSHANADHNLGDSWCTKCPCWKFSTDPGCLQKFRAAESASLPVKTCPKCGVSMSWILECDNGHEFQGPDYAAAAPAGTQPAQEEK